MARILPQDSTDTDGLRYPPPMDTSDAPAIHRRELELLLHSLSHDLRTPAMTVLGFAELLAEQLPATARTETAGQYLQHIRSSAQRQLAVIEKLQEYTRWSYQPMQRERIDMSLLCRQAWQQFPATQRDRVDFSLGTLPTAQGDRSLLVVVWQALLDNALKFTRHVDAPRITCQTLAENGVTWFTVTDNGLGFHPDQAEHLFRPFQKLHANKQYEGPGMGLCIAARIIERHHGRIEMHGQPNQGTTVRFCLGC